MAKKDKASSTANRTTEKKPTTGSNSDLTQRDVYRGPSAADKIEQSFQKGKSITLDRFRTLINWD